MTEPNFNQAAESYETWVLESNEGVNVDGLASESYDDVIRMGCAAQKLKLAVETYLSELRAGRHIGEVHSTAEELCVLIIDYDQDTVGHQASDVLRAALKGEK